MGLTVIESDKVEIDNSAEYIFNYLSDFNNHEKLMPPQVTNWVSTVNDCSFTLNGMATIGMKIVDKTPNSKINITQHGKAPFDFELIIDLTEVAPNKCIGQMTFKAELNPMMKMMVAGPMGKFFNYLASKLKSV